MLVLGRRLDGPGDVVIDLEAMTKEPPPKPKRRRKKPASKEGE